MVELKAEVREGVELKAEAWEGESPSSMSSSELRVENRSPSSILSELISLTNKSLCPVVIVGWN